MDSPLLNHLSSYLTQRLQVVLINWTFSDNKYTSCGAPQGSVVEPLWFLIYVNDIAKNINAFLFSQMTPLYIILPYFLFTCIGYFHKIFPRYTTGQRFGILTSIPVKLPIW